MPFPFVTRSHHDEVTAQYRERVAALEKELYRLKDHIFQNAFGVQIHDSLPIAAEVQTSAPAAAPQATVEQTPEERERAAEMRQLAAIRRTSPSRLGSAMTNVMQRRALRMARAAFPTHTTPATQAVDHPAKKLFQEAKREALG